MPRLIAVLENIRILQRIAVRLHEEIDASRGFFGARTMFCWRALYFLKAIERRFFDAESTDADASIDRGARKGSKTVEKIIAFAICLHEELDASRFSGPEKVFAGAPYISLKKSTVGFSTPNLPMPTLRLLEVLENDRKFHFQCSFPLPLLSPPSSSPLSSLFFSFPSSFLPRSLHSVKTR